jgi:hypothetical protein
MFCLPGGSGSALGARPLKVSRAFSRDQSEDQGYPLPGWSGDETGAGGSMTTTSASRAWRDGQARRDGATRHQRGSGRGRSVAWSSSCQTLSSLDASSVANATGAVHPASEATPIAGHERRAAARARSCVPALRSTTLRPRERLPSPQSRRATFRVSTQRYGVVKARSYIDNANPDPGSRSRA